MSRSEESPMIRFASRVSMSAPPCAGRWLIAALVAATTSACAVEPADEPAALESIAVQASTPVQNINTAETSFRNTVVSNVTASTTAAGLSLAAGLSTAYVPRNRTIASAPTTSGAQAMFLSRTVRRSSGGSFGAGLYELSSGSAGVVLHYHDPVLGRIKVPPPVPAPFHTPLGDDMCGGAPSIIMDFCQSFVACAAYDLWC